MTNDRFRNTYLDNHSHFCTASVVEHLPVLDDDAMRMGVLRCWDRHRRRCKIRIEGFVLMTTHIHLLVRGTAGGLKKFMQYSLAETSRGMQDALRLRAKLGDVQAEVWLRTISLHANGPAKGKVWQERFRCLAMDREDAVRQKLDYMHNNPVKAGMVSLPEEWPWSSYLHYAGGECVFRVDTALADE